MKHLILILIPLGFLFFSCNSDSGTQPSQDQVVMEKSRGLPPITSFVIEVNNIRWKEPRRVEFEFDIEIVEIRISGELVSPYLTGFEYDLYLWWSTMVPLQWWGPFTYTNPDALGGDAHRNDTVKAYVILRWHGTSKTSNTVTFHAPFTP